MIAAPLKKIEAYFRHRQQAYQYTFPITGKYQMEVLQDLLKFCYFYQSTFHPDPRIAAQLDGRREVILRILENLNLTIDEVYALHPVKNKDAK